jgi:hypothetical protein
MAINFPNPATLNQTHTVGSKTWVYNGYAWDLVTANTDPILVVASSAFGQANSAFDQANTGITVSRAAFVQANSGFNQANAAYTQANVGIAIAQSAFNQANSEPIGKSAFGQANAAYTATNTAITVGQAAYNQANAAYNTANTKFSANGGTISGSVTITTDLSVTGNIYLGGNVTTLSSNNLVIDDSIIYLAQNNPANLNDIGIVGHFTTDHYQHTGFVRDATDGVWKLFSNVSTEPTTTIDFSGPVIYDSLKVGSVIAANAVFSVANGTVPFIVSSNTLVSNLNVDLLDGQHGTYYTALTGYAFDQANTGIAVGQAAFLAANTETIGRVAFGQANAAYNTANTGITVGQAAFLAANTETIGRVAFGQANSAFNQANSGFTQANAGITLGQTIFGQANAAYGAANTGISIGQAAFSQANTGITVGQAAFVQANSGFTQANAAYGAANTGISISQAAFVQANVAYGQANTGITVGQAAFAAANTAGSLIPTSIKTANGYIAVKNDLVRCNTAAGAFSVSFPANPNDGDIIGIIDIANTFGINNLTLLPNTKFIELDSVSYILDINGAYVSFMYNTSTTNWRLLETPNTLTSNGALSISTGAPTNINGLLSGNGSTLSGVTLKTVNGNSLIGSGDITITGGGSVSSGFETNFLLMGA